MSTKSSSSTQEKRINEMFTNPFDKASSTNDDSTLASPDSAIDDDSDYSQDWTTITHPRDTFAQKERRRSMGFGSIPSHPFTSTNHPHAQKSTIKERRGSILSIWNEPEDIEEDDTLVRVSSKKSNEGYVQERRGSILSVWKKGKDENGKDVILSEG